MLNIMSRILMAGGALLSIFSIGYLAALHNPLMAELPDAKPLQLSFAELKHDTPNGTAPAALTIPPAVRKLVGKKIEILGYVCPPLIIENRLVLSVTNMQPTSRLSRMPADEPITVTLTRNWEKEMPSGKVRVFGILAIDEVRDAASGDIISIYSIRDASMQDLQATSRN